MASIHKRLIQAKVKGTVLEVEEPICQHQDVDGDIFIVLFTYKDNGKVLWGVAKIWGTSDCEVATHGFADRKDALKVAQQWCEIAKEQEEALEQLPMKVVPPPVTPFEKMLRERREKEDKEEE